MNTSQQQPHDTQEAKTHQAQPNLLILGSLLLGITMILFVGGYQLWNLYRETPLTNDGYSGSTYEPPVEIPDFILPASTGGDLSLSDLEGNYVLLFFGFTNCPDVCPTTLAQFRQVKSMLGDLNENVTFLFISVDPERDTPDMIREYIARFDTDFIGLSGDDETLAEIGEPFGLYYQRREEEGANYSVDHTGRSFLLDQQGDLIMSFAYGTDAEVIADGVRQMMR